MYGYQSYPTNKNEIRFNLFDYYKKNRFVFGYADHTFYKNNSDLLILSLIAITKGSQYIEKHIIFPDQI